MKGTSLRHSMNRARLRLGRVKRRLTATRDAARIRKDIVQILAKKSPALGGRLFKVEGLALHKQPRGRELFYALGAVRDTAYLSMIRNLISREQPNSLGKLDTGALRNIKDALTEQLPSIRNEKKRKKQAERIEKLFNLLGEYGYSYKSKFYDFH